MSDQLVFKWFHQISSAVKYLHTRSILHRDLKSANVFLTAKGHVRVGDLGLARKTKRTAKLTKCGTDCYMAPEVISSKPYGKKADVWSLGCILFEMLSGVFMSELPGNLGARAIQGSGDYVSPLIDRVPQKYVPHFTNLMKSMLKRDPSKRISAEDLCEELEKMSAALVASKKESSGGGRPRKNSSNGSTGGTPTSSAPGTPQGSRGGKKKSNMSSKNRICFDETNVVLPKPRRQGAEGEHTHRSGVKAKKDS
eukprot:TRINITY_DN8711_c0_g1_i1.p1 TRINITY_DN8711_c0_g1~~TRINITY_DN8711_c0_g1_i1.p1  ORF type:complete len:253 (-),score=35.90 TRINITY_DN8711_c0_g1_i1:75-833(-)